MNARKVSYLTMIVCRLNIIPYYRTLFPILVLTYANSNTKMP